MSEDIFVQEVLAIVQEFLKPPLLIRRGESLLYQVTVNNQLQVTANPRSPARGQSAFETDLCVFEQVNSETEIPRVVMECKKDPTTHDVLIYSAKARRHKSVYPYLRYGLVVSDDDVVPGKFFTHNEFLDFYIASQMFIQIGAIHNVLEYVLTAEVEASRQLERIAIGNTRAYVFRNEIILLDQDSFKTTGAQP